MQRSGLPLMILAAVMLIAAAALVFIFANPFGERQADARPARETPSQTPPDETPAAREDEEPSEDREPTTSPEAGDEERRQPEAASDQEVIPASTYGVRTGDNLFDIAGEVWGDAFLWPLLLEANDESIEDPDYLRPGQTIRIPQWVTVQSGLTEEQRSEISEAHVLAYHRYRALGDDAVGLGMGQPRWWLERLGRIRLNKAHWVLYSGLRYDEDLVDDFGDEIRPDDAAEVRSFRRRYGLPPTRR